MHLTCKMDVCGQTAVRLGLSVYLFFPVLEGMLHAELLISVGPWKSSQLFSQIKVLACLEWKQ